VSDRSAVYNKTRTLRNPGENTTKPGFSAPELGSENGTREFFNTLVGLYSITYAECPTEYGLPGVLKNERAVNRLKKGYKDAQNKSKESQNRGHRARQS
jgi:hypothetical protein